MLMFRLYFISLLLYLRADEVGTPFCITIDYDTLTNGTVTIRERDSMNQQRVHIDEVTAFIRSSVMDP